MTLVARSFTHGVPRLVLLRRSSAVSSWTSGAIWRVRPGSHARKYAHSGAITVAGPVIPIDEDEQSPSHEPSSIAGSSAQHSEQTQDAPRRGYAEDIERNIGGGPKIASTAVNNYNHSDTLPGSETAWQKTGDLSRSSSDTARVEQPIRKTLSKLASDYEPEVLDARRRLQEKIQQTRSTSKNSVRGQIMEIDARNKDDASRLHEIYRALKVAAGKGAIEHVDEFVGELVVGRGEKPNLRLYGALILANVSAEGSATKVQMLLRELADEGLTPDSELYHNALRALAVHPDPILRSDILQDMRRRWLNLTPVGWHDVVTGCIREDQLELAFEYLDEMRLARIEVQAWLYDLIIYALCEHEELDEALRLIKRRVEAGEIGISAGLWYYLFDTACELLDHSVLRYVWTHRVEPSYLIPNTGQCLSVLNSCSRSADVSLATDVFRVLSERGFVFSSLHYELLMAAYLANSDLKTALTITCIMSGAGMAMTPSSLASISSHLALDSARPLEALALLQEMVSSESRAIPTPVVTCLIESAASHRSLQDSVTIYKTLHKLCPSGPDVHVFNALFHACDFAVRDFAATGDDIGANEVKETAMFLASEMLHLRIRPNALTYDRLLLVCLRQQNSRDAFRYLEEMLDAGFEPRLRTWVAMFQKLKMESDVHSASLSSAAAAAAAARENQDKTGGSSADGRSSSAALPPSSSPDVQAAKFTGVKSDKRSVAEPTSSPSELRNEESDPLQRAEWLLELLERKPRVPGLVQRCKAIFRGQLGV